MTGPSYPSKVARVLRAIEYVGSEPWHGRPWENVTAEDRDGLWVVRAERPGNVFTAETLTLYVAVHPARVIEGTDIKLRAGQRFQGGYLSRFGDHRRIDGWQQLHRIR